MNQNNLAIIILNWNGWQDTIECLESLFKETWQQFSVVIIDNGSKDNSLKKIISWIRDR
ncbi:MAG: glycosyltransferase, partial [bacterium]